MVPRCEAQSVNDEQNQDLRALRQRTFCDVPRPIQTWQDVVFPLREMRSRSERGESLIQVWWYVERLVL